ncbi:MAG TPA: NADP-dependent oxidoreductase [Pseudonocardia sp.]|nr:NADP-dependent oxidoreductase [Pseudonocardia sp.]
MSSDTIVNHQVRLAARPDGMPEASDFALTEEPVPSIDAGQLLVKVSHVSLDPAMRGWMDDRRSYVPPVGLGEVMRAFGAGEVVASRHPVFAVGDVVTGVFGVQEYAVSDGSGVLAVDTTSVALPTYLSLLGLTGLTAYFGLFDVGSPREGETVLVSGAAGATGHVVGQLAKIAGCRVVGIAGGPEKCAWLTDELGFDACVDYREPSLGRRLAQATPDGVDVFFDNVGGEVLDAGLARLALGARVVICGAISQYNTVNPAGPSNYLSLLINRARMQGFLVTDYADRFADAAEELAGWAHEGRLRSREDVVEGSVADFPATLLRLFRGENIGKLLLHLR